MSYHPITPISPALLGLLIRSVPLAGGCPHSRYSVIIPLHNKEKSIERTILSVLNQTKKLSQIIIIDDKSTDNSFEIAKKFESSLVEVYQNSQNLGKAETINTAIYGVKYPFVLILDADTYLEDTYVHHILKGFYDRRVKGCCGLVLPSDEKTRYENSRLIEYVIGQNTYKIVQTRIHGIWVLAGCATMWRTFFLRQNPIPDKTVVEDMDITWLAQTKKDYKGRNFNVNFNPKAICYTEEPKTFHSYIKQLERWFSIRDVVKDNFGKSKLGLKFTCLWLFGEFFSFLAYSVILLYSIFSQNWLSAILLVLFDFALALSLALYNGKKLGVELSKILKAIPSYYLLRLFNFGMFLKCLIKPKRKW